MPTPTKSRARTIRWHLFQVLVICIVPVGLFGAGLLYLHWQAQEKERERSQVEAARLLAAAIDNELESTIQRLGILSRLWAHSAANERVVYDQARAALDASPDWLNVVAFRADGSGVFRSDEPLGSSMRMQMLALWQPVLSEQRPLVTDVFTAPVTRRKVAAVGVPVVVGGRATHVLIATLKGQWFDDLLMRQGMPEGAVSGVIDSNFKFVSRSLEGEARRGADAAERLVADMRNIPEGIGRYTSLNNNPVYTSWTRTRHGWWVAIATPSAPVDAAFWRHLTMLVAFWILAVAAAIAIALAKAARISSALRAIEGQAAQLARGRPVSELHASDVEELAQALGAVEKASRVLQATMIERDRSLVTEREAREAAEGANLAKDEFLAMLGHELRNPLAAITHAAALAGSARTTPEQVRYAHGVITRQSEHLKRLVDDLLDVGRVMQGKISLQRELIDLAALARDAVGTLDTAGRLARRRVEVEAKQPVWINGDPTRVEQIVGNLLNNAATYSEDGGRIRLSVQAEDGDGVLTISDEGCGIPPEALPRIFELFYQAETSVDRTHGGLGIGLTLVQHLVRLHGGSIHAASAGRGKGATFTVRLPAVIASLESPPLLRIA